MLKILVSQNFSFWKIEILTKSPIIGNNIGFHTVATSDLFNESDIGKITNFMMQNDTFMKFDILSYIYFYSKVIYASPIIHMCIFEHVFLVICLKKCECLMNKSMKVISYTLRRASYT